MSRNLPHHRHTPGKRGVVFVSFKGHESRLCHGATLASLFDCIDDGAYDGARMRGNVADLGHLPLQIVLRDVSIRGHPAELLRRPLAMPVSRAAGGPYVPRDRGRIVGVCADRRPRDARHALREARSGFVGMQGPWSMLRQGLDSASHPECPRLDRSALFEPKGLHTAGSAWAPTSRNEPERGGTGEREPYFTEGAIRT